MQDKIISYCNLTAGMQPAVPGLWVAPPNVTENGIGRRLFRQCYLRVISITPFMPAVP